MFSDRRSAVSGFFPQAYSRRESPSLPRCHPGPTVFALVCPPLAAFDPASRELRHLLSARANFGLVAARRNSESSPLRVQSPTQTGGAKRLRTLSPGDPF